ncbi:MAG: hypothetical protein FWD42_10950 [Solirubrobacterales bacterium]|nr:hypothetical protein [Solirubrobacterales bacterium]
MAEQASQTQAQEHTTVTQDPVAVRPGQQPADAAATAPAEQAGGPVEQASGPPEQAGRPPEQPSRPPEQAPVEQAPVEQDEGAQEKAVPTPGFGERGRMRRRARFLRKARELAYRDLGGLVYDLHRFGQRNDAVVLAKLATLGHIDAELRALEQALHEIRPVTVLREVGIAACPRCAAIHGHEDRFCPGCGLAFSAGAERPLSTVPVTSPAPTTPSQPPAQLPASQPAAQPPALRPTAAPVAARPPAADRVDGNHSAEDEPTQILRPPVGGS